jgi:hypothetical protein
MLERPIEEGANRWAIAHGIRHRKMNGKGQRSWPDQLYYSRFFLKGVKGVFIEYKATGKKPTKLQYEQMDELRAAGFDVAWFDNKLEAVNYLKGFLDERKLQKALDQQDSTDFDAEVEKARADNPRRSDVPSRRRKAGRLR